ncbi:integrase, partial [Brevibacterium sp. UCMA 11754]|nr:integrase [Brevibacterium sp. UCMA 11754]
MATRAEITTKYARQYKKASKKNKGAVLKEVVAVTAWTRDNARRRLTQAAKHPPGPGRQVTKQHRKPRSRKYSYDAVKILQRVCDLGRPVRKYLHATMRILLDLLEAHHELVLVRIVTPQRCARNCWQMSPATIDRYLGPTRAKDAINGISTTKPGSLLRSAITIRRAGDDVEDEPGFFEGDTVAHCGPVESGEFARTLNLTDFHTGWTFTRTVRNNAHTNIL